MSIFQTLKSIAEVLLEANKIEQYKQILEAQSQLLEMQESIYNLKSENTELKEKLIIKEKLIHDRNSYWIEQDEGKKDGPFCTGCWDNKNKLIRLETNDASVYCKCLVCENSVSVYPERSFFRKKTPYSAR